MQITITENVTNALIAGTSITVDLSYVGVQGPPGLGGTADYAVLAGTSVFATTAGTSVYATNAGTSVFATNAGTSVFATTSGTATYATNAGTSVYSTNAGTSVYGTNAGTSVYATNAGTSVYSTTSGTAVNISGTIAPAQVTGTAAVLDTNTFTGKQTLPASTTSAAPLNLGVGSDPTSLVNGDLWLTNSGLKYRLGTSFTVAVKSTNTFTGKQTFPVSTTSVASINIADGTAPTSPSTGDLWAAGGSLIYQSSLGANTIAFLSSNITGNAASITGSITASQVTGTAVVLTSANTFTVGGQVIKTGADATSGLQIWRNSATQTADLLTAYQSDGTTVLAKIAASGALTVSPTTGASAGAATTINAASSATLANIGLVINSNTGGGGGNAIQIYNTTPALISHVGSDGTFGVRSFGLAYGASLAVGAGSGGTIGVTVRGVASQSADLQQWQNSAGTVLSSVSSGGNIFIQSTSGNFAVGTNLGVKASSSSTIPFSVAAAGGQSVDLTRWYASDGTTVLAKIDSVGAITGTVLTSNGYVRLSEQNSGGRIRITKATAAVTNPGANLAELYFRDGTNANTLKLVVRAGAAGAETTILDNIPT